jgi:GH24 family phage-related lysozyme (muramidase)
MLRLDVVRAETQAAYEPPPNCVTLTRYFYPPSERDPATLTYQLHRAERMVAKTVICPLQPCQREALICLVSDLVSGLVASNSVAFEKSFLVTALNKGMFQIAVAEFHVFCYVDGKVQTRAWEKRRAEQYLFSRGHLLFE